MSCLEEYIHRRDNDKVKHIREAYHGESISSSVKHITEKESGRWVETEMKGVCTQKWLGIMKGKIGSSRKNMKKEMLNSKREKENIWDKPKERNQMRQIKILYMS